MKANYFSKFTAMMACIMALLLSCSCSNSAGNEIISADDLFVIKANAKAIAENAGCQASSDGIKLSSEASDLVYALAKNAYYYDDDVEEFVEIFTEFLSADGVDYASDATMVMTKKQELVMMLPLSSSKKFASWMEQMADDNDIDYDTDTEDGYTIFKLENQLSIFMKGSSAIAFVDLRGNKKATVNKLEQFLNNCKENSAPSWLQKGLSQGNAFNMSINIGQIIKLNGGLDRKMKSAMGKYYSTDQIKNSVCLISADLDGLSLNVSMKVVDSDGKAFTPNVKPRTIDTALLKYTSSSDQLVTMAAMPEGIDWKKIICDIEGYSYSSLGEDNKLAIKILNAIDGSVLFALQAKDVESLQGDIDGISFVLAGQIKEGKESIFIDMITENIDYEAQRQNEWAEYYMEYGYDYEMSEYSYTRSGNDLDIVYGGMKLYFRTVGNTIVITNNKSRLSLSNNFSSSRFKGNVAAIEVNVTKKFLSDLPVDLPFGANAYMQATEDGELKITVSLTETKGKLLENIIRFVAGEI